MALLYDRILRHRQLAVNKSDMTWNWSFDMPCKSLKVSWFYLKQKRHTHETRASFTIPAYKKSVTIEGKPNQLYAQGMRLLEQYDEICKYFTEGKQNEVQKHLQLHNVSVGQYLTDRYAL